MRKARQLQGPPPSADYRSHAKVEELTMFTRQVSTMIEASVPLVSAVCFYATANEDTPLGKVVSKIADRLNSGTMLSRALQDYPNIFSGVYVGLVRAGEDSGQLHTMLGRLANLLERNLRFRKKVVSALTYPAFLILGCLASMMFFLLVILPALVPMFAGLNLQLPLVTRILIGLASFLKHPITLVGGTVGLALFFGVIWPAFRIRMHKDHDLARKVHYYPLIMPVIGSTLRSAISARLLHTLATLLEVGIPASNALLLCSQAAGNAYMGHQLLEAHRDLCNGDTLSEALSRHSVFPDGAIQMMVVGEESACALSSLVAQIAQVYEEDAEMAVQSLVALIEPLILGVMGVVSAFLILATILPIITLLKGL